LVCGGPGTGTATSVLLCPGCFAVSSNIAGSYSYPSCINLQDSGATLSGGSMCLNLFGTSDDYACSSIHWTDYTTYDSPSAQAGNIVDLIYRPACGTLTYCRYAANPSHSAALPVVRNVIDLKALSGVNPIVGIPAATLSCITTVLSPYPNGVVVPIHTRVNSLLLTSNNGTAVTVDNVMGNISKINSSLWYFNGLVKNSSANQNYITSFMVSNNSVCDFYTVISLDSNLE
jgi:hypothetical protein